MNEYQHIGFGCLERRKSDGKFQVLRFAKRQDTLYWDSKHLFFVMVDDPYCNDSAYFSKRNVDSTRQTADAIGFGADLHIDRKATEHLYNSVEAPLNNIPISKIKSMRSLAPPK